MPLTGPEVVWVLVVMMTAALVQSLGGFGFALLAVPLAAIAIDLRIAVVAVSIGSLFNTVLLCVRTRRDVDRVIAKRFNVPALLGMPLGLFILTYLAQRPLKVGLGLVIIVATVALMRGVSNLAPRAWLDVAAGGLSGVLSTATGTNGPPLVLALQMRQLPADTFRATLALTFTITGSASLAMFALAGLVTRSAFLIAVAAIPLIIIGQRVGLRMQPLLSGRRFDRLVYGLLLLSGISVAVSGMLGR